MGRKNEGLSVSPEHRQIYDRVRKRISKINSKVNPQQLREEFAREKQKAELEKRRREELGLLPKSMEKEINKRKREQERHEESPFVKGVRVWA